MAYCFQTRFYVSGSCGGERLARVIAVLRAWWATTLVVRSASVRDCATCFVPRRILAYMAYIAMVAATSLALAPELSGQYLRSSLDLSHHPAATIPSQEYSLSMPRVQRIDSTQHNSGLRLFGMALGASVGSLIGSAIAIRLSPETCYDGKVGGVCERAVRNFYFGAAGGAGVGAALMGRSTSCPFLKGLLYGSAGGALGGVPGYGAMRHGDAWGLLLLWTGAGVGSTMALQGLCGPH